MNSQTPASRRSRAANANRWVKKQQDAGAYRLSVLLPPESAAALDRLVAVYGSKRAAVIAAIQTEENAMNSFDKILDNEMAQPYRDPDYRMQCRVIRTAKTGMKRDMGFLHEIAAMDYPTVRDAVEAVEAAATATC